MLNLKNKMRFKKKMVVGDSEGTYFNFGDVKSYIKS